MFNELKREWRIGYNSDLYKIISRDHVFMFPYNSFMKYLHGITAS